MALMHDGQTRQNSPETPGSSEAWWKNKAAVVALIGTLAAGGISGAVLAGGEDTPNPEPTATASENPVPETNPSVEETPTDSQTEQTQSPETENELEDYMPLTGNEPVKILSAFTNNLELYFETLNPEYIESMGIEEVNPNGEKNEIYWMAEYVSNSTALNVSNKSERISILWTPNPESSLTETIDREYTTLNFEIVYDFKPTDLDGTDESRTLQGGSSINIQPTENDNWTIAGYTLYSDVEFPEA